MTPRYANLDPTVVPHGLSDMLRWSVGERLRGTRTRKPAGPPAPRVEPDREAVQATLGPARATWIGHASFLITTGGAPILVDPHLGTHAGGLIRRVGQPGLTVADLPDIAAILLSHNHYDHLDAFTLKRLPKSTPVFCPLGLGSWFRRRGYRTVTEMGWWDSHGVDGVEIHFVPARHWSRRHLTDTNRSWWGGYVLRAGSETVYHAGDSAACPGFAEIGRRFPDLDAALLPVGAYDPGWFMERYHMTPEQAGEAFVATGARVLVPMHWGAFKLADEPLCEPAERITAWWNHHGPDDERSLALPSVGETLRFDR